MVPILRKRKTFGDEPDEPVRHKRQAQDSGEERIALSTTLDFSPSHRTLSNAMHELHYSHDLVLESLDFVGTTRPSGRARKLAKSMERQTEAIRGKLLVFNEELCYYKERMSREAVQFHGIVMTKPRWYANKNVLVLPYTRLVANFEDDPIADAQHFYEYLSSIVPWSPNGKWQENVNKETMFAEKVWSLVQSLKWSVLRLLPNADYYYFHALVLLAAQAFRPELWAGAEEKDMIKVKEEILTYLKPSFRESEGLRHRAWSRYWNFASAKRELWATWNSVQCIDRRFGHDGEDDGYAGKNCWHVPCRSLLEYIQVEARREIRSSVVLAVGRRLPAELMEEIFELTMAIEECPVDTHICSDKPGENPTYFSNHDRRGLDRIEEHAGCNCEWSKRLALSGTWKSLPRILY